MARITVEDCVDKVEDKFELIILAANRAKKINCGSAPQIESTNDKSTVIALREISEGKLDMEQLKNIAKNQIIPNNSFDDDQVEGDNVAHNNEASSNDLIDDNINVESESDDSNVDINIDFNMTDYSEDDIELSEDE